MTPEQQKVINRCRQMLKLVFPNVAGKFIFRLSSDDPRVKVDYVQYSVVFDETTDAREGVTV